MKFLVIAIILSFVSLNGFAKSNCGDVVRDIVTKHYGKQGGDMAFGINQDPVDTVVLNNKTTLEVWTAGVNLGAARGELTKLVVATLDSKTCDIRSLNLLGE